MGRKRRKDTGLPRRMYRRGKSYYYVDPVTAKWINLGSEWVEVMRAYGELSAHQREGNTVADLIDRYLREVVSATRRVRILPI
jgi:hypothetical protein